METSEGIQRSLSQSSNTPARRMVVKRTVVRKARSDSPVVNGITIKQNSILGSPDTPAFKQYPIKQESMQQHDRSAEQPENKKRSSIIATELPNTIKLNNISNILSPNSALVTNQLMTNQSVQMSVGPDTQQSGKNQLAPAKSQPILKKKPAPKQEPQQVTKSIRPSAKRTSSTVGLFKSSFLQSRGGSPGLRSASASSAGPRSYSPIQLAELLKNKRTQDLLKSHQSINSQQNSKINESQVGQALNRSQRAITDVMSEEQRQDYLLYTQQLQQAQERNKNLNTELLLINGKEKFALLEAQKKILLQKIEERKREEYAVNAQLNLQYEALLKISDIGDDMCVKLKERIAEMDARIARTKAETDLTKQSINIIQGVEKKLLLYFPQHYYLMVSDPERGLEGAAQHVESYRRRRVDCELSNSKKQRSLAEAEARIPPLLRRKLELTQNVNAARARNEAEIAELRGRNALLEANLRQLSADFDRLIRDFRGALLSGRAGAEFGAEPEPEAEFQPSFGVQEADE